MRGEFIDAQARHKAEPKTFDAPSQFELDTVKIGDFVKVGVELGHGVHSVHTGGKVSGERFWVQVTAIDGKSIVGTIDSPLELFDQHDLVEGDTITVEQRHVLATR